MFALRLLGGTSLDGPDGPVTGRAALRQRIALLALLAVEHPRPLSRDKLVADLWPESGTGDARHLLRESLYILRSALGDDAVLSAGDDLRLNPDRLTCDLWEFEAALARDDLEQAVSLYHGPFLNGFHLSEAEEFEHWVDTERSRLARRYSQALEQLAERELRDGDRLRAVEWWSRLAAEDPYNSRVALRYMQALEAAGDRAAALRHASTHSELLRTDLDAVPEREVLTLAERLRLESRAAAGGAPGPAQPISAVSPAPDGDGGEGLPPPVAAGVPQPARHRWVLPAVMFLTVVAGIGVLGGTLSRARPPELAPRRVAVAVFENRTGRPDLDDLGTMAADWIIRGLMETPVIDVTDLEVIYAAEPGDSGGRTDPRALARRNGAGLVISGNYYRSGDSVLFQAAMVDVASGRVLRSFTPVSVSVEKTVAAVETLRNEIAVGLGALVNPADRAPAVDPDLIPPPNLAAYRQFIAGLKQGDWETEFRHYRRAAELDSTFAAPLIQLAFRAFILDDCHLPDSIGTVLDPRREQLTPWDRLTIDLLGARCRGEMETAVRLLGQRLQAYPRSRTALRNYAAALQHSNQPSAAQEIMGRMDPRNDAAERSWWMALSHHTLGQYSAELEITERDTNALDWLDIRGRALSALGRDEEAFELCQSLLVGSDDAGVESALAIATELQVHGRQRMAVAVTESVLVRLKDPSLATARAPNIAWANRLLGREGDERAALERLVAADPDTMALLDELGRIAVLAGDTAEADRIDGILAEQTELPLIGPRLRGSRLLARAHIAAGLGRREQAVALLREAVARSMLRDGPSHVFHVDLLLAPLRGYPPFDALLKPDN